jgi:hypothetical protein
LGHAKVGVVGHRVWIHNTWCEQREGQIVAAVNRQIADSLLVDSIGLLRLLCLNRRSLGRDGDCLAGCSDLKCEILFERLTNRDLQAAVDRAGCGRLKDVARKAFDSALRRHQDNAIKRAYAQAFERTQNAAHARLTVMRKIVAVMRAMWINQTPYRDELG